MCLLPPSTALKNWQYEMLQVVLILQGAWHSLQKLFWTNLPPQIPGGASERTVPRREENRFYFYACPVYIYILYLFISVHLIARAYSNSYVKNIFSINVWRKSVFDIYFNEFGAVLTTVLPVLFKYCYKYCYSDSGKLWAVVKAGGLAL